MDDSIFDDIVSDADLQKHERIYNDQLRAKSVARDTQFTYACCLVRSRYYGDIKRGIVLLEELYKNHKEYRRDYLYYLAVGNARIKNFQIALKYCRQFLQFEPSNVQVLSLENRIQTRLNQAGRDGAIAAGGGILALGVVVGAGVLISKLLSK